jgi:Uma2 family endonuclease
MSTLAATARMSYPEYVAAEAQSDTRHEYLRGEVFAMAGGTPEHGALAMAIGARLVGAVRGKPCRVFGSDDRGQKAGHYRRIPSLREYLLVSQREPRLELFRRTEDGGWQFFEAGPGAVLELVSIGARLEVDEIYRDPLA